ncbi:phosphoribosyltransferase [Nocardia colli]|uniref:Phosphoribosyltransferase n=1 Tax=Nocardia colli TaxID=2545717 RepID=A0A5N0E4N0_9NOCA|nr:phosphoribosyltransferase family protein [Nocardia colli]KAA8884392.1 phosphoribosyltransferase [Nocardia colli]
MDDSALSSAHTDQRAHRRSLFIDRRDAGRRLADRLQAFRGPDVVVLGVPRGGVQVACEVAANLQLPLDTIVVNKLRVPYRPDLSFGAISEDDTRIIDEVVVRSALLTAEELAETESHERASLYRRSQRFRVHSPPAELDGRTALVVDDSVATGITAQTACRAAYRRGAVRVVLAVPVAPHRIVRALAYHADKIVCLETPPHPRPLDESYLHCDPVTDTDVGQLLGGQAAPARIRLAESRYGNR